MNRKHFIKSCCYSAIGISLTGLALESCGTIYYAQSTKKSNKLVVAKSEFIRIKKDKQVVRDFVLIKSEENTFPICLYKNENNYTAALLKCTHRGCELNVGGDIYTCPCHASEFSTTGTVLQGPADKDLKMYKTETDNENIYIHIS